MQKDSYFNSQALQREFDNQCNKFAFKLLNGKEMVSHLPHEYSRIAWYFLACGGSISVEVAIVDTVKKFVVEWSFPAEWCSPALERQC